MKLLDFFQDSEIIRDKEFSTTYSPFHQMKGALSFACSKVIIDKINRDSNVSVVITYEQLVDFVNVEKGVVISKNPQLSYYELHNAIQHRNLFQPLHHSSISDSAKIAKTAQIGKNVHLGKNVRIGHGVIVNDNTFIDDNTLIEDYVVIGAMGMQNTYVDGNLFHIAYAGGVKIGKNCQILSHAIIQRPYQNYYTTIGNNVQISVQVVVGHGVQVGNNTQVAGNCQISGNAKIGNNVLIGPSSVISDGIVIDDNVNVKIGSTVISNLAKGEVVSGNFAFNHKKHLKELVKNNHQ